MEETGRYKFLVIDSFTQENANKPETPHAGEGPGNERSGAAGRSLLLGSEMASRTEST